MADVLTSEHRRVVAELRDGGDHCNSCHDDQDYGYAPIDEAWPVCCCRSYYLLKQRFPGVDWIELSIQEYELLPQPQQPRQEA